MARRSVVRFTAGKSSLVDDVLVSESPVEFRLEDVPVAVLMRTAGNDEELGLGFAITEGIVLGPHEVVRIAKIEGTAEGDRYEIILSDGVVVDPEQFRRNFFTSSSCGVCGKASIDAVRIAARVMAAGPTVDAAVITRYPAALREAQTLFADSGSIHGAGAFTPSGEMITIFEDVGRHNAVDKVIGFLARATWPIGDVVLFVSGRVSFEMVQKAAVAGIAIIAGVSGASDLAVELGDELNMTVIGFVRGETFNVYCGSDRIVGLGSGS
ncbi:MAG: formate dehydrogenase accessory sulfurtransferase FdhD [Actinomycetia bacterium]|nr:formate dehydrogenase accessory sulfurtransferase FdhD [Actinomycetes bacterium]